MSFTEVLYRFYSHSLSSLQKQGYLLAANIPDPDINKTSKPWLSLEKHPFATDYCAEADSLIAGNYDIFALKNVNLGHPVNWNKNPLTGHQAPLFFGKTLDYRDENVVGDIKYLWEPSRHLHLVTFAQAYFVSKEKRYLDAISLHLTSWINQCPYMKGVHWTSSLELAIRLINWSFVWQLIGGDESRLFAGKAGQQLKRRWLTSIFQHVHFIRGHYSKYSSANNHLIGESAGVFIATTLWPFWSDFDEWRADSKALLQREALIQNGHDGVNKEQAMSYQQFVLDFLIIAGIAARSNNDDFSHDYWHRIEAMLDYVDAVMDCAGNVPMIGDADDGLVVRLTGEPSWNPYLSLLGLGAVLFNRQDYRDRVGGVDDKTVWLLGNTEEERRTAERLPVPDITRHTSDFTDGGYYILGSQSSDDNEVKILVDAGPLGYREIAAHGHADALSFVLNYCGEEFLIDPGTFSYHTHKKWREYFRGTSAHNTACIDGLSQSVSGGNFMWSKKANAWCETFCLSPKEDLFVGAHDGYSRLEDPVTHRREIRYNKQLNTVTVIDDIECLGQHTVELFWHFSETCALFDTGGEVTVSNNKKVIKIELPKGLDESCVVRGDEDLPLGWVSRSYDVKEPSNTLVCTQKITGNTSLKTMFLLT